MISLIQNILLRHGRWIFIILLAIIIVAFVFTIGNTPGITTSKNTYEERSFYGFNLNDQNEINSLARDFSISILLRDGKINENQNTFQNQFTNRLVQLYLIKEINLPNPSKDEISKHLKEYKYFQNESNEFDESKYSDNINKIKSDYDIEDDKIIRIIIDNYKINKVNSVIQGLEYSIEEEVDNILNQQNTEYDFVNIKIDFNEYNPDIEIDPNKLDQFFEERKNSYKTSEKFITSYLKFVGTENLEEVANDFIFKIYNESILLNSEEFSKIKLDYGINETSIDPYSLNDVNNTRFRRRKVLL